MFSLREKGLLVKFKIDETPELMSVMEFVVYCSKKAHVVAAKGKTRGGLPLKYVWTGVEPEGMNEVNMFCKCKNV